MKKNEEEADKFLALKAEENEKDSRNENVIDMLPHV